MSRWKLVLGTCWHLTQCLSNGSGRVGSVYGQWEIPGHGFPQNTNDLVVDDEDEDDRNRLGSLMKTEYTHWHSVVDNGHKCNRRHASCVCFSGNRECVYVLKKSSCWRVFNGCPVTYKRFMDFPYCTRRLLNRTLEWSSSSSAAHNVCNVALIRGILHPTISCTDIPLATGMHHRRLWCAGE